MHTPALLKEVIKWLDVKPGNLYIDTTIGEGGHTLEIMCQGGKVLGIELDNQQYQLLKIKYHKNIANIKNLILVNDNFKNIQEIAKRNNFWPVDGVLFDLGLSMRQIKESGRGFSFKKPGEPLDMRINLKTSFKAADLVNSLNPRELYEIFTKNAEEINSWAIANAIFSARKVKEIRTVGDLIMAIDKALPRKDERIYQRIFQALRISVNNEFENLKQGLEGAINILKPKGRISIITFHSLEDRIVKNFIKKKSLRSLTKKPIVAENGRKFEKSAKLRIICIDKL